MLIPLLDHLSISLAVRCESHHQQCKTRRWRFVLVGVLRVPCLPLSMCEPLHQRRRLLSLGGHAEGHDYIKQFQTSLGLPSGSYLRCQADATWVGDFF